MTSTSRTLDPRIVAATDQSIRDAVARLTLGKLVGIPTETVYGLAANAWDATAVEGIFSAKQRPAMNPLIVHIASVARLSDAIAWPVDPAIESQLNAVMDLWPGPLTLVCERGAKIPDIVTAGQSTVAVRIPSHPVALALLDRCPFPIAAPSANPSNYVSPTTAAHVANGFDDTVSLILDGGPCRHGVESTIVALRSSGPMLLRPGSLTAETLSERFKSAGFTLSEKKQCDTDNAAMLAPGMMRQHYSPRTRLVLLDPEASFPIDRRVGRIAFQSLVDEVRSNYTIVETLSQTANLAEVAQHLFAAIRRLDEVGLDEIHCDVCEEVGIGRAIMDRLRRAASQ